MLSSCERERILPIVYSAIIYEITNKVAPYWRNKSCPKDWWFRPFIIHENFQVLQGGKMYIDWNQNAFRKLNYYFLSSHTVVEFMEENIVIGI